MTNAVFVLCGIVIFWSAGFMVWQERRHAKERKDLLNRLMARDLGDLRIMDGTRVPPGGRNSVRAGLKRCSGAHEQGEQ